MDSAVDVIERLWSRGITIWLANGQLRYKAPKGALTPNEIAEIRLHRDEIVSLLERTAAPGIIERGPEARPRLSRAPLTFSQLAHWNFFQLGERRSSRIISSALRLRGPLNIDALRNGIAEIVRRHDALRTRIPIRDGAPIQEIDPPGDFGLRVDDLTALTEGTRGSEIQLLIENHSLHPIDVAVEALFRAQLLIIGECEHVLVISIDHIVSDGLSLQILLNEVFTAYLQAKNDGHFSLPAVALQLSEYAIWQRSTHDSWMAKHASYWDERLRGCQRLKFPFRKETPEPYLGWGSVSFCMSKPSKQEFLEWCKQKRTTLVMSVFTAYVALVLRWCNAKEAVFLHIVDGRLDPVVHATVGYFAFPLYLRIGFSENDSLADLLSRVTDEYCNAHEHADSCYLETRVPMPEFTRNTIFNWLGQNTQGEGVDSLQITSFPLEHKAMTDFEMDTEPSVTISEHEDEIQGRVNFALGQFSTSIMERFARNIPAFIRALIRQPAQRVRDVRLL